MTPILKYPGAKWRTARWIISFFKQHKVYCEPFAGSAAVLFNKPKKDNITETLNDLSTDVTNFFKTLRDYGEELAELIDLTPYSRDEYYATYENTEGLSDLERARRYAVRCHMSIGDNVYKNGWKNGIAPTSPNPAKAWGNLPETIIAAAECLRNAQIENKPAEEIIVKYNNPETLLYVDPPYHPSTRGNKRYYKHEMLKECEHESLLHALKDSKSMIVLSGYDNKMYNGILRGWQKFSTPTTCEQGLPRTETLWINYDVGFLPMLGGEV